jgi:hypothetical protein
MTCFSKIALILSLVILSATARAQTEIVTNNHLITLCQQRATDYVPEANVEYQPGIDVDGNPVVSADIGVNLGENIYPLRIPLEMDLLERFNLDIPQGIIADAEVAGIMVYEDGRVTYNGHDISSKVETFCVENEIITTPPNYKAPQVETKTTTTTSDGQIEIEPLKPPQEGEIIKGEYH